MSSTDSPCSPPPPLLPRRMLRVARCRHAAAVRQHDPMHSLYVKGRVQGFKRGKRNQRPNTSLIQVDGVSNKEEAQWYLGKVSHTHFLSSRTEQRAMAGVPGASRTHTRGTECEESERGYPWREVAGCRLDRGLCECARSRAWRRLLQRKRAFSEDCEHVASLLCSVSAAQADFPPGPSTLTRVVVHSASRTSTRLSAPSTAASCASSGAR